jgi:hypothetical protein
MPADPNIKANEVYKTAKNAFGKRALPPKPYFFYIFFRAGRL